MTKYRIYHVMHTRPCGWLVKGEKAQRASSVHYTKEQAIERGRALAKARKGQLIIHKGNGKVQIEYTYGHDPASRPG